jgi:hypothetical protein
VEHFIRFIEDDRLPPTRDWMLIRTPDAYYFFVKRSKVSQDVLEQGWAAYVDLASKHGHLRSA